MSDGPANYTFVLAENFSHMPFSCALEAFRIANLTAERELYRWRLTCEGGGDALSSNGTRTRVDYPLEETPPDDAIIVVAGVDAKRHATPGLVRWLRRRESHTKGRIGAICCGAYILAEAGLLDGRACAIHWEYLDALREDHPGVDVRPSVFVKEGRYFSASGGVAATDLSLSLIEDDHGEELARQIAERLVYASVRTEHDGQRFSRAGGLGLRNPRLARAVELMETNLDEPLKTSDIAAQVGLSTRQLERLTGRYLNSSPKKFRMEARLARARHLLRQTEMSVIDVAIECGFTSPSHFSKCYRSRYGETPYQRKTG
ncbi:MAG: GlxA family transcriptional regulator [Pseudomonadota bacterium]